MLGMIAVLLVLSPLNIGSENVTATDLEYTLQDTTQIHKGFEKNLFPISFIEINPQLVFPKKAIEERIYNCSVYLVFNISDKGEIVNINVAHTTNEGFKIDVKTIQVDHIYSIKVDFELK
jgi:hypothetical protein